MEPQGQVSWSVPALKLPGIKRKATDVLEGHFNKTRVATVAMEDARPPVLRSMSTDSDLAARMGGMSAKMSGDASADEDLDDGCGDDGCNTSGSWEFP